MLTLLPSMARQNYRDLTKEQLIKLLEARDRKKFGLVWERDSIEHDRALNDDFVVLDAVPELDAGDGPHENLIIEGDNFDGLRALRVAYAGKVKCIYIDPPYNTGNRDFVYNDRFVDKDHAWRHSMWIEFMFQRLTLARDLLAQDGAIFVSIDDNEGCHLRVLMDEIFGAPNFVACFVWRKVDSPNDNKVAITPDHEFLLCYALDKNLCKFSRMSAPGIADAYGSVDANGRRCRDRLLKKNGKSSLRRDRPSMFFPIIDPDGNEVYPIHENGEEARWAKGIEGVKSEVEHNTLVWKKREKLGKSVWEPYTREYAAESPERPYPTIWSDLPTMRQAKAMLRDIFGTSDLFSTPKPVGLIRRILQMMDDPSALVLDFFAGSGTTAHAVFQANLDDGGNRRFILISNAEATTDEPEKNLCRDVCRQRVANVIAGYGDTPGTGGGFAYLRTRRIPMNRVVRKIEHAQVWLLLQLMHFGDLSAEAPVASGRLYERGAETQRVFYLTALTESIILRLEKEMTDCSEVTIYTWQPEALAARFDSARTSILPIPQILVERFGARP